MGLGPGDELANALVLKQFLFRREEEKPEEVDTELQLEDLEIDLDNDAELEHKAPGNPYYERRSGVRRCKIDRDLRLSFTNHFL